MATSLDPPKKLPRIKPISENKFHVPIPHSALNKLLDMNQLSSYVLHFIEKSFSLCRYRYISDSKLILKFIFHSFMSQKIPASFVCYSENIS